MLRDPNSFGDGSFSPIRPHGQSFPGRPLGHRFPFSGVIHSLEPSSIDSESSTGPGASIFSGWDDEFVDIKDYTPHTSPIGTVTGLDYTHGFTSSPQYGDAATWSSPYMSDAPAEPSYPFPISRLDDIIACHWVSDGGVCGDLVKRNDIGVHLQGRHGIRNGSREKISCLWLGCDRSMNKSSFARHVAEVHLGVRRTVRSTYLHADIPTDRPDLTYIT